jgi:hypothetical protein
MTKERWLSFGRFTVAVTTLGNLQWKSQAELANERRTVSPAGQNEGIAFYSLATLH